MKYFGSGLLALWIGSASLAVGQTAPSLSDYFMSHPWDAAHSGPMLVVDPDGTKAAGPASSLVGFERMEKTVGELTAIVPTQMVIFDESFKVPNMYDALDRNSKVLYLLSTLTDQQWKTVLAGGIGMADLDDRQQKVFESILPKVFTWHSYTVDRTGQQSQDTDGGTLSDTDLKDVRLYLGRQLMFALHIAGSTNSYGFLSGDQFGGSPNTPIYARNAGAEGSKDDVFGSQVRASVPNEFKSSQLDYARYQGSVSLPESSTIGATLASIGSATGLELHGDLRVNDLPLVFVGGKARAGDVLKAIALGVTGTYRRVGSAYVLTSDLMGMGERKVRFALWGDAIAQQAHSQDLAWERQIGQGKQIFKTTFPAEDPTAPSATLFTPEDDSAPSPQRFIPAGQLNQGIQQMLQMVANHQPAMHFDTSGAALAAQYRYGFVLPTGQKLRLEGGLGRTPQFSGRFAMPKAFPGEVRVSDLPPADASKAMLSVKVNSESQAKGFADLAARKGFAEFWVETQDPSVLSAAVEAAKADGVPIRLMVHPWSFDPLLKSQNSDRTILLESAEEVEARKESAPGWSFLQSDANWLGAWEAATLSPMSDSVGQRWQGILALGKTPGLAGVVLMDTVPAGYEGQASQRRMGSSTLLESIGLGYSPGQRLAFLRANGIDPIDIAPKRVSARPDLRQPFFTDEALRPGPMARSNGAIPPNPVLAAEEEKWDKFRGDLNSRSVLELADGLDGEGVSVLVEARNAQLNTPADERTIVQWLKGQDLPVSSGFGPIRGDMLRYYDLSDPKRSAPFDRRTVVIGLGPASLAEAREAVNAVFADKATK